MESCRIALGKVSGGCVTGFEFIFSLFGLLLGQPIVSEDPELIEQIDFLHENGPQQSLAEGSFHDWLLALDFLDGQI